MSNFVIKCDKCEEEFVPQQLKLQKRKLAGISVLFFNCPVCNYAYPVKYTDKHQKELDSEIESYTAMIAQRKKLNKTISQARIRKLNSLLESSKAYQEVLRDKYQTAVTTQLNQSGEIETISITGKEDSHEQ